MNNTDWLTSARAQIGDATTQASTLVRTLALAAVAMAWSFAGGFGSGVTANTKVIEKVNENDDLRLALRLAVIALTLDAFQYLWTATWTGVHFWYERALVGPTPIASLTWRDRFALRAAQASGLLYSIEEHVNLDSTKPYADRHGAVRELMVRAWTRDDWTQGTSEALALNYLGQGRSHAFHLTNVAFALKTVAVTASYVCLLKFVS